MRLLWYHFFPTSAAFCDISVTFIGLSFPLQNDYLSFLYSPIQFDRKDDPRTCHMCWVTRTAFATKSACLLTWSKNNIHICLELTVIRKVSMVLTESTQQKRMKAKAA